MRVFRIRIEVDITARDREQADRRARLLYSDLEHNRRPWVQAVLPDGIEERQTIIPNRQPSP
jgi:hypothetical protein